jgi:hypothetical protein
MINKLRPKHIYTLNRLRPNRFFRLNKSKSNLIYTLNKLRSKRIYSLNKLRPKYTDTLNKLGSNLIHTLSNPNSTPSRYQSPLIVEDSTTLDVPPVTLGVQIHCATVCRLLEQLYRYTVRQFADC